jgi:hypothetical protein
MTPASTVCCPLLFALRKHTASFPSIPSLFHSFNPSKRTGPPSSQDNQLDLHVHRALTNRISTNSRIPRDRPRFPHPHPQTRRWTSACKYNAVSLRQEPSAARAEWARLENAMAVVASQTDPSIQFFRVRTPALTPRRKCSGRCKC